MIVFLERVVGSERDVEPVVEHRLLQTQRMAEISHRLSLQIDARRHLKHTCRRCPRLGYRLL